MPTVQATAIGVAGGAIATALMKHLVDKGALTTEEANHVLQDVLRLLEHHVMSSDGPAITDVITNLMRSINTAARRE